MSRAIAILGTGSDVGKSLVATALCRLLYRYGVKVAPFKAQNMSLNSFVTPEGGEMGRAQVLQAQACGLPPSVLMNPILLKPEADNQSQVIVRGKVWERKEARAYFNQKAVLWEVVRSSYGQLAEMYDVIVIEGAGSAAEMNLRDRDIVNWPVVEMADASVILVADIDQGGVFAQVIGTMGLLSPEERRRVIGVVINKFRGDLTLFDDGIKIIEERIGLPVLGVLPYVQNLELDQEDSVGVEQLRRTSFGTEMVNVAVVLLPHMSNFTDFNQLIAEPDVAFRYVALPRELQGADIIILPGSKTTIADLQYIRELGFEEVFLAHVGGGGEMVGVCGGFQMLGKSITDPHHVETGSSSKGLGFLDVETELLPLKKTRQVCARPHSESWADESLVEGYEIHMGETKRGAGVSPSFEVLSHGKGSLATQPSRSDVKKPKKFDGAIDANSLVWGTYIHGVFDQPRFRRQWLNHVRVRKSLQPLHMGISQAVSDRWANAIDCWADHVQQHLNLTPILVSLGRGETQI